MKKGKLILSAFLTVITCLLVGIATACNKNNSGKPVLEAVTIVNKSELTRDWYVGGLEREVKVSFSPYGLEDTQYTVSSSAETVVSVSGNVIKPVGEGSSVITVTAENKTDSVTVTVKPVFKQFTVTNKSELSDSVWHIDTERTVEIAYDPADKYNAENMPAVISIESDVENIFEVNGLKITAKKLGSAVVNVTAGGKTESFAVRVVNDFVSLSTVDPDYPATCEIMEGEAIALPELVATAPDGRDITQNIQMEISGGANFTLNEEKTMLTANTYNSAGAYTVTYEVVDGEESDKLVLSVNVYRNIFSQYNEDDVKSDTGYKENTKYVANENQKVVTTHGGDDVALKARFNMQPSKKYYAEATFNYPTNYVDGNFFAGLGHYLQDNADKHCVIGAMDMAHDPRWDENNFFIRDYGTGDAKMKDSQTNAQTYYWYSLSNYRQIFNKTDNRVTVQTARIDDTFYYFVNGYYLGAANYEYFRGKATIPGIFGHKIVDGADAGVQDISNIIFVGGDEAQTKLDGLLFDNANSYGLVTPYVFWKSEDTYISSRENRVVTHKDAEKGVHFSYDKNDAEYYAGAVSPNLFFEKDFTFSFDYKNTSTSTTNAFMQVQLRTRKNDKTLLQAGILFDGTLNNESRMQAGVAKDTEIATKHLYTSTWTDIGGGITDNIGGYPVTLDGYSGQLDDSQGVRFTISRKMGTENAIVRVTVTSIANPEQSMTQTYTLHYTDIAGAKWDDGVQIMWNNYKCAGEYSNITWKYEAVDKEITLNKESAILIPGEQITLKAQVFPLATPEWSSSDETVATVNNGVVTAVGNGTAVITATANGVSAEFTLTVASPVLNVEYEAPESFYVGDKFNITASVSFNGQTVEATVNAVATGNAVTVNGLEITASEKGDATVTVSVTYRGKLLTETITGITVKPVLGNFTVENEDALKEAWTATNGDTKNINASLENANDFTGRLIYSYTSSDEAIATVSNAGVITATGKQGTTVITVTVRTDDVKEGEKTITFNVSVTPALTAVTVTNGQQLSEHFYVGAAARKVQLSYTPSEYYTDENTTAELTVSQQGIITVDSKKREITPVGAGAVTLTVAVNGVSTTVEITVIAAPTSISVSNSDDFANWMLSDTDSTKTAQIVYAPTDFTLGNTPISVTLDKEGIITAEVTAEGVKITQVATGAVKVTVSATDTVYTVLTVNVVTNPTIEVVSQNYQLTQQVLEGETVNLPELLATNFKGDDITGKIKVELSDTENMSISDDKTKVTLGVTGTAKEYTLTYSVTDEASQLTSKELVITVKAYRNVFSDYNTADVKADTKLKDDAKYVANENQKVVTTHGGKNVVLRAGFNITPSKLYFAEATFNYPAPAYVDGDFHVGMGHYLTDSTAKRSVVGALDIAAGNLDWNENYFYIRNYDPDSDSSMKNSHITETNPAFAWYRLNQLRGSEVFDKTARTVTIQTARSGNSFYMFVNGNFIGTVDYEYFRDKDTIPGIFGYKIVDNGAGVQDISNIRYYDGSEAQTKLDDLLYNNTNSYGLVTPYVFEKSESGYSASADNKVVSGKNEARGIYFDYDADNRGYYDSAVSPNVLFNGDFTFSFDYKNTSVSSTGAFMQLQVRPRMHKGTLFQVGAIFNSAWEDGGKDRLQAGVDIASSAATESKMFVSNWSGFAGNALGDSIGAYPTRTAPGGMWSEGYDNVDNSQGYRYTLTFKKEATQYTVKATVYSLADTSKILTQTYTVSSENLGDGARWDEGFILVWNNYKCAGEYSNITWSYSVAE